MNRLVYRIGIIAPLHPASREVYRRVLRLLNKVTDLDLVIVKQDGSFMPEEEGRATIQGLTALDTTDCDQWVLICWELPALTQILVRGGDAPIAYGLSFAVLQQGVLPVHSRIIGYFSDVPFMRAIVTSCGIPIERQHTPFSLQFWPLYRPASRKLVDMA